MIESAAYELIKKEGFEEGMERGLRQGMLQAARDNIIEVLEVRFDVAPRSILKRIREIDDPDLLKMLHKKAIQAESIDAFKSVMMRIFDSDE